MDDIQNWMRSIHPSRPTTPFTDSSANAAGSSNLNQNRTSTSATKPRRPTVERLSSFFPHLRTSKDFKMSASDQEHEPFYNAKDNVYNPDVDMMANTLLTVSMSNLGKPLGAEYGSFLLHVLEAYRYQKRDLAKAAADLDDVKNMMEQLKLEHERDAELWAKEKATYKAEIKRREVLMVQGKTGMEGVMLARAESVLHKDNASKYAKGAATAAEKRRQAEQAGSSATEQDFAAKLHVPTADLDIQNSRKLGGFWPEADVPFGTRPSQHNQAGFASMGSALLEDHSFEIPGLAERDDTSRPASQGSRASSNDWKTVLAADATGDKPDEDTFPTIASTPSSSSTEIGGPPSVSAEDDMTLARFLQPLVGPTTPPVNEPGSASVRTTSQSVDENVMPGSGSQLRFTAELKEPIGHRRGFSFGLGEDAGPSALHLPMLKDIGNLDDLQETRAQDTGKGKGRDNSAEAMPASSPAAMRKSRDKKPTATQRGSASKSAPSAGSKGEMEGRPRRDDSAGSTKTVKRVSTGSLKSNKGGDAKARSSAGSLAGEPSTIAAVRAFSNTSRDKSPLSRKEDVTGEPKD